MRDDEVGVVRVHRERAAHYDLARQIAGLLQDVVDARPMHGEQYRVRILRRLARCARPRFPFRIARELLELLLAVRVAEHHFMPRSRPDRAELAAHEPRTETADAHGLKPRPSFELFRVAFPMYRDLCSGVVDLTKISGCEFYVDRPDVFLQTVHLLGSRNRDDPRLLREEPGERDLRRRRSLRLCDPA